MINAVFITQLCYALTTGTEQWVEYESEDDVFVNSTK